MSEVLAKVVCRLVNTRFRFLQEKCVDVVVLLEVETVQYSVAQVELIF